MLLGGFFLWSGIQRWGEGPGLHAEWECVGGCLGGQETLAVGQVVKMGACVPGLCQVKPAIRDSPREGCMWGYLLLAGLTTTRVREQAAHFGTGHCTEAWRPGSEPTV